MGPPGFWKPRLDSRSRRSAKSRAVASHRKIQRPLFGDPVEMGVLQRVGDVKMLTLEEGRTNDAELNQHGHHQGMNYFKLFKWFININVLLLLIFCGYALCSLYQLESAMKSRESTINWDRYLFRYDGTNANRSDLNDSLAEFNEWRRSVVKGLENSQDSKTTDTSNNLKVLLHSIISVARNFVDNERKPKNKVLIANLTNFEIGILREFAKLKMSDRETRIRRTVKGGADQSQCNLQFSFQPEVKRQSGNVIVIPLKPEQATFNIQDLINNSWPGKKSETRECKFNIIYEPPQSKGTT